MELQANNETPTAEQASTAIHVISSQWKDRAFFVGLLLAMVIPSLTVFTVIASEWISSPSQRGWLILGFGFYIFTALKALWEVFVRVYEQMLYLRVEVQRLSSPTLFEALTYAIEEKSEQFGQTCSWDQEARQEHDKLTGNFTVKLRFWSSAARRVVVSLHSGCDRDGVYGERRMQIQVLYRPGEEVVLGRDSRQERREVIVLSVRTSKETILADKKLLCQWLNSCYATWVKPVAGVVIIYGLQESSTEWVPNWERDRVKPVKNTSGTGHSFFFGTEYFGDGLCRR